MILSLFENLICITSMKVNKLRREFLLFFFYISHELFLLALECFQNIYRRLRRRMLLIIHNCLIRKQRDLFNMIDTAGRVEDCNSLEAIGN